MSLNISPAHIVNGIGSLSQSQTAQSTYQSNAPIKTIPEQIEKIRDHYLADQELEDLLASNIDPSGSRDSGYHSLFNLEEDVLHFIHHKNETLLLLIGNPGSGKTIFGKYLVRNLWRTWKEGERIPLFISIGLANHPKAEIIEETLANEGLSSEQIRELKENYRFIFILDGYDEMRIKPNLYVDELLKQWNAKVIISCCWQYLQSGKNSYLTLFAPLNDNGTIPSNFLQEDHISPFTEIEIDAYLKQYINQAENPSWRDYTEYKRMFQEISELAELITNPFLLYITAEVLPDIVEKHTQEKPNTKIELVRKDLYKAFIEKWFIRSEGKLRASHRLDNYIGDFKEDLQSFCEKLATAMHMKNLTAIEYNPSGYEKSQNEWEDFFGNNDSRNALLIFGSPIQKIDKTKYAFLHKSFQDYFTQNNPHPYENEEKKDCK